MSIQELLVDLYRSTKCYNTYTDMIEDDSIEERQLVKTLGYYEVNDGGGAEYIKQGEEFEIIVKDGIVNVKQFGAKGDGINDDTKFIQKAIDFTSEYKYTLLVPYGEYILNSITEKIKDGWHYQYAIELKSNITIKGNESPTFTIGDNLNYFSIFLEIENCNNVVLQDFSIKSKYLDKALPVENSLRKNFRNSLTFISKGEDIQIMNIKFLDCCGVNPLHINGLNDKIKNVTVKNCMFNYKCIGGKESSFPYYDRSVVYMECTDYLFTNNAIYGSYETLGGVECHGRNGVCSNNKIYNCHRGINLCSNYKIPVVSSNNTVENNNIINCSCGITLWGNSGYTWDSSEKPEYITSAGYKILNNNITIDGKTLIEKVWRHNGWKQSDTIAGITTYRFLDGQVIHNLLITGNTIILNDDIEKYSEQYKDEKGNYMDCSSSNGIGLCGDCHFSNVNITNNYISGVLGSGISIGQENLRFYHLQDIIIKQNILRNCGTSPTRHISSCSPVSLKRGNAKNILIVDNIFKKDTLFPKKDGSVAKTPIAVYSYSSDGCNRHNIFCYDNVFDSCLSGYEYKITSSGEEKDIILKSGTNLERCNDAPVGWIYYDISIHKSIVMGDDKTWRNLDGTTL